MANTVTRYRDLAEYVEASGRKKFAIAADLGISRYQMTALLHPTRYGVTVDDDLAFRIAALLNQPIGYVRRMFPRKVAA